jgi:hypothetical protein
MTLHIAGRLGACDNAAPWSELSGSYQRCLDFVEGLQEILQPMRLATMSMAFDVVIQDGLGPWTEQLAERQIRLEVNAPQVPAVGVFDPSQFCKGLRQFVDWRAERIAAGTTVGLSWGRQDGRLYFEWREDAAERWKRTPCHAAPLSLGLAKLAKVVSEHDGSLLLDREPCWRLRLDWPASLA